MIWVPGREAAPFSGVLTAGWELLQQGIGWPGASHVDLDPAFAVPKTTKSILCSAWGEAAQGSSCLPVL